MDSLDDGVLIYSVMMIRSKEIVQEAHHGISPHLWQRFDDDCPQ
jgi:hypothetical protein